MGFLSKLRGVAQKVVGKDPVAQAVMKVDPLAKRAVQDIIGLPQQPSAATPMVAGRPAQSMMAPRADAGWQSARMDAIRARFGGGGMKRALPLPGAASSAVTAPGAMSASVQPAGVGSPMAMPAGPGSVMSPAQMDVQQYARAWDADNSNMPQV